MGRLRYEGKWMVVDVFEQDIDPLHELLTRFEDMDEDELRANVMSRMYVDFDHQTEQCPLGSLQEILLEGVTMVCADDGKWYLRIRWLGFEWEYDKSADEYKEDFQVPPAVLFKITDEDTIDVSKGFVGFFCDDTWYFFDAVK